MAGDPAIDSSTLDFEGQCARAKELGNTLLVLDMAKKTKQETYGIRASSLIEETMSRFLMNQERINRALAEATADLGPEIIQILNAIMDYKRALAYREAVLIQTAFALVHDDVLDLTIRAEGARDCGRRLGEFFSRNHISGTKDAFQSIGKNTENLLRNVLPEYDQLLLWTRSAEIGKIRSIFNYIAASLAAISKPVKPMPRIDQGSLNFGRVTSLINELLDTPSQGAYQQFLVAAFLEAAVDEFGAGGINGFKADTKSLTATDASSRVVGDVQLRQRGTTIEAFEVTANDWTTKIAQASQSARNGGLRRIHILASVKSGSIQDTASLENQYADLSVLDIKSFLHTVIAFLQKPTRAVALERMHRLLLEKQPRLDRVNDYVNTLEKHGLVVPTQSGAIASAPHRQP